MLDERMRAYMEEDIVPSIIGALTAELGFKFDYGFEAGRMTCSIEPEGTVPEGWVSAAEREYEEDPVWAEVDAIKDLLTTVGDREWRLTDVECHDGESRAYLIVRDRKKVDRELSEIEAQISAEGVEEA